MKTKNYKKIKLPDGTPIYCLKSAEAIVLDDHVKGYFNHGIALNEGDVVVDVGANIGVFGVRASQWFNEISIHSFEPVPAIFDVLNRNCQLSGNKGFKPYQLGVGSKAETLRFTYFPNSPALSTSNPDLWDKDPDAFKKAVLGSIRNSPDSFWWSKWIPDFSIPVIAWYLQKGKIQIECYVETLSNIMQKKKIEKIDLLKMDCEGHEWEVLKGIDAEDWPKIKSIVMEIHDIENRVIRTKELLTKKGFTQINLEKEKALENTDLVNLFAIR